MQKLSLLVTKPQDHSTTAPRKNPGQPPPSPSPALNYKYELNVILKAERLPQEDALDKHYQEQGCGGGGGVGKLGHMTCAHSICIYIIYIQRRNS